MTPASPDWRRVAALRSTLLRCLAPLVLLASLAPFTGASAQLAFTPGAGTEGRHWLPDTPTAANPEQRYTLTFTDGVKVVARDGTKLDGRLILPVLAPGEKPTPCVLMSDGYGRTSQTGARLEVPLYDIAARGYAVLHLSLRGSGTSEGVNDIYNQYGPDGYDAIEWMAKQPWCDGKVGMVGISGFGAEQFHAAKQNPPHLKAIFPFDPRGAYGTLGSFREEYPGGVIHLFRYLIMHFAAIHGTRGKPGPLPPEKEALWEEAMRNPDYRMYPHLYNVLTQKGQHMPPYFDLLIDPYDKEEIVESAEKALSNITIPAYTGCGWYAYTYKTHLNGAQNYFKKIPAPKKLMFIGPAHLERPFHTLHSEILRWHDHWLKDIDTGVMNEPPVRYWLMGANEWRTGTDWPLPETQWTKLYLTSWERLRTAPFTPGSVDDELPPDAFVQMPPTQTNTVQTLRFMTDPLPQDVLVAGPSVLNLFAEIDQDDTNWIITLKDVGPDASVRTVREGERELPRNVHERELTRG